MSENAWAHDPAHPEPPTGRVIRPAVLSLDAYIERADAERKSFDGPTMAQWLEEIRKLDWGTVTVEDIVDDIRSYRDRDES
ncbi:hypothetical protein [Kutzneria sp. 744]|uniref:hypothetical protein n=1 Tax=Kutzneria sp. (strain 744) TaxID=345341 RepID=UPI0003EEAFFB|nr:hypothetical protein [Kutzneria sp. 744]EWM11840.1 hypothetical protein KUTG_02144 [Kutzneria sp. 744]